MESEPRREVDLYRKATDALFHLHTLKPPKTLSIASAEVLTSMLDPFFDEYVNENHKDKSFLSALQTQLRNALNVVDHGKRVLSLRDCHSENLMFLDNRRGFASVGCWIFRMRLFTTQPMIWFRCSKMLDCVAPEIEMGMIAHYLSKVRDDHESFLSSYRILGVQRNLRILGIFARLARHQGKFSPC